MDAGWNTIHGPPKELKIDCEVGITPTTSRPTSAEKGLSSMSTPKINTHGLLNEGELSFVTLLIVAKVSCAKKVLRTYLKVFWQNAYSQATLY